jgi:hypothetical protein
MFSALPSTIFHVMCKCQDMNRREQANDLRLNVIYVTARLLFVRFCSLLTIQLKFQIDEEISLLTEFFNFIITKER